MRKGTIRWNAARTSQLFRIYWIVQQLIEDITLVERWEFFCDKLELGDVKKLELRLRLQTTRDHQTLFQEILTGWKATKGDAATVEELIVILRTYEFFTNAADCLYGAVSSIEESSASNPEAYLIEQSQTLTSSQAFKHRRRIVSNRLTIIVSVFIIVVLFGLESMLIFSKNQLTPVPSNHTHQYEDYQIGQTQLFSHDTDVVSTSPNTDTKNRPNQLENKTRPVLNNREQVTKPIKVLVIDLVDAKKYLSPVDNSCKNKRVTIIANITDPLASIEHFITDLCFENVIGLELAGFVTEHHFELLVQKFPKIEFLIITGFIICHEMESYDFSLTNVRNQLSLSNLIFLEISNTPECVQLFYFIFQSVSSPHLLRLELIDVVVTMMNQQVINRIIHKNPQLLYILFEGIMCDNCHSFAKNPALKRANVTEIVK